MGKAKSRPIVRYWMEEDDPTYLLPLFQQAYKEFPEFRTQPYEEYIQGTLDSVEDSPRLELVQYNETTVVAGAALTPVYDPHVGRTIAVLWQYVLPEYRPSALVREVLRAAQELAQVHNAPTITYSHRSGVGTYIIKYRKAAWVIHSKPLRKSLAQ